MMDELTAIYVAGLDLMGLNMKLAMIREAGNAQRRAQEAQEAWARAAFATERAEFERAQAEARFTKS